ncbi:hypothetical protein WR25_10835 [Diploscapter pachys]|uniref:C-type lectin domain-containing protein n=1 Tax=Diploscapter pachys TaxID=2018661 RepID=A0A2A2JB88_9BILA|nr:hypothetical protein WR25_10835 [Diploscapter pachys]
MLQMVQAKAQAKYDNIGAMIWIGYTQVGSWWQWIDGSEPQNLNIPEAAVIKLVDGKWAAADKQTYFKFICSNSLGGYSTMTQIPTASPTMSSMFTLSSSTTTNAQETATSSSISTSQSSMTPRTSAVTSSIGSTTGGGFSTTYTS